MNSSLLVLLFLSLFFSAVYSASSDLRCLDESGNPVDWWVVLKFPYNANSSNDDYTTGYAYAYADASMPVLQISSNQLNTGAGGAVGRTLSQIKSLLSSSSVGSFFYNDEDPSEMTHSSYAHMKGVVAFGSQSGFWMIHSVPRYPNTSESNYYLYPAYAKTYGQSYLCISMDLKNLDAVGSMFLIDKPYIYKSNFPSSFDDLLPNLSLVMDGKWAKGAQATSTSIYSLGGQKFTVFAKNSAWNNELYEYLVQPYFKKTGYFETWQNGVGSIDSWCPPKYTYTSLNIELVRIGTDVNWVSNKDHSKWGVFVGSPNVCIGDINRQTGQYKRGGGTVCFSNSDIYKSFSDAVGQTEDC